MVKYTFAKSVEASKLNKRTMVPLGPGKTEIPFGAIVEAIGEERDEMRFSYLGEPYSCPTDTFRNATRPE